MSETRVVWRGWPRSDLSLTLSDGARMVKAQHPSSLRGQRPFASSALIRNGTASAYQLPWSAISRSIPPDRGDVDCSTVAATHVMGSVRTWRSAITILLHLYFIVTRFATPDEAQPVHKQKINGSIAR